MSDGQTELGEQIEEDTYPWGDFGAFDEPEQETEPDD